MIIRIGKVGDRLAYPTAAQIEEACEWDGDDSECDEDDSE
jgi:hypothetical protein